MATTQALRQALELSASNFRPKNQNQWVEDMLLTWMRHPAVLGASDAALESAIVDHMGSSQFAPKLADIVGRLRQGGGATGYQATSVPACAECSGTGWAEGSALLKSRQIEGPVALVCGCKPYRGVRWQDWRDRVQARQDVDRWWITGKGMPRLPDEARLTAEQLRAAADRKAAMERKGPGFVRNPVDPHAAERKRAEKQVKAEGYR